MTKGLRIFCDALESGKSVKVTTVGPGVRRKEELSLDELREKNWQIYAEVGRKIQLLRADKRLTVKQLANLTGINETVLQRLEAGKLPVTDQAVTLIAKALGVRKSEIHSTYGGD